MKKATSTAIRHNTLRKPGIRKKKGGEPDWFVYLLRCADGSLYTGISNDVPRRIVQHNAGTASRYTRSRLPAVLVYHEPQASRSMALKRELAIKALSRQEKESLIRAGGTKRQKADSPAR
jgi:UV DNA damage endonuclease